MAARLRCLFVSPAVPWPPDRGGRVRTYHLLRELGALAEVHLRAVFASPQDAAGILELGRVCASAQGFERAPPGPWTALASPKLERWFHSPALAAALAGELASGRFDLVHLDEMFQVRSLPRATTVPLVVHHHKLDVQLARRLPYDSALARAFDVAKLRRLEAEAARRSRFHVLTSAVDAELLRRAYPKLETSVVESGFDPEAFLPPTAPRRADELLFLGSLDYAPNLDGLAWFVSAILPRIAAQRPGVRLRVVGSAPGPEARALAGERVEIVGAVPDVRPELARASALVVPLRIGGGTRLKIVEALGSATPVVSTSVGAEGLAFQAGEHLSVADAPDAFAQRALEVLAEPALAAERARCGRELALERYTWPELAGKLCGAWQQAAAET